MMKLIKRDNSVILSDLIDVNTRSVIKFPASKKEAVFALLKNAGFGFIKSGKYSYYIRRELNGIQVLGFFKIRDYFHDYYEALAKNAGSQYHSFHDLMNAYYRQMPLKESNQVKHQLATDLDQYETHLFRLQVDDDYERTSRTERTLENLQYQNFVEVEDTIGTYHSGDKKLFYKKVNTSQYLVLNDMDSPKFKSQIFDCWLSTFAKESDIGKKRPVQNQSIALGFQWDKHQNLIASYL